VRQTGKDTITPTSREALGVSLDERLARLRREVMARKGSWVADANPFVRDVALWRAWEDGQSVVRTRARLLLELVKAADIVIPPDWHLAGEHLTGHGFGLGDQKRRNDLGPMEALGLSSDECQQVLACHDRWCEMQRASREGVPAEPDKARVDSVYWANGWIENHSIRDYAKVLRIGFDGIRAEVVEAMQHASTDAPDHAQRTDFWHAALDVCEAGRLLGERYADVAEAMAREACCPDERRRLETMAEACRRVPAQGARTLFEATQSLWLAHILTCGEDGINANSIGRLDQLLHPFYEADVEAARGYAVHANALRLMEELACKMYLDYDVQAIALGGLDRHGNDATNEMSHIILEATDNIGFVRDVSVRLSAKTSLRLVEQEAELIARGGGIPFIFNDECFVPALTEHGIAIEDARNYAPIGCIELTVPGRANPHAVSGWFNALKCLELALFDGVDPRLGKQIGPKTGALADFGSYEDLDRAYRTQVETLTAAMVHHCNRGELAQQQGGPLPCWSTLTDDCIVRGRDITDGGAVYNYHSICLLGTANTADALCALRKLVFEEGVVEPAALSEALRADFDGFEPMRKQLLEHAPKYGNDVEEVDAVAADVANHFIDLMDQARSPLGGRYFVHLFTFLANLEFGRQTGATPDGRHAGEPLAYSLSAHQGRDREGATAMLKSLARMPHHRAAGASAAIIDLDPKVVEGEAGHARLVQMLRAAVGMGVGQLQFNVTTVERLRQAQEDPERYGNIPVRVAGYSQMFRLLTKDLQEHVIARTKHEG